MHPRDPLKEKKKRAAALDKEDRVARNGLEKDRKVPTLALPSRNKHL